MVNSRFRDDESRPGHFGDMQRAEGGPFEETFDDNYIRRKFVRKVFTLVALQLFISTAIIFICIFVKPVREYLEQDVIVLIVSSVVAIVFFIALSCCQSLCRKVPVNYILLTFMTLGFAVMAGAMCVHYPNYIVFGALATTAGIVLLLALLATSPCIDFTGWIIYVALASIIVALYGMIAMILILFLNMRILFLVYAGLMTVVICFYILIHIQMIIGGRKFELSTEEYVYGAVLIFTDIIMLFMLILELCSGGRR